MDALAGLLEGPRARGAFLLRSMLDPPWSLRVQDEAPLTLVAVVRGDAWVVPDDDPPVRLRAGDVGSILTKLSCRSRADAVRRASELGLLPPPSGPGR